MDIPKPWVIRHILRMWNCDIIDCANPAVRQDGQCLLCDRHLCAKHSSPEYHECPPWKNEEHYDPAFRKAEQKEINSLIQKINVSSLLARATELRHGIPCSIPYSLEYDRSMRSQVMGGINYHIEVQFADGVKWLARIRRCNATSAPPELRNYIMRSEIATLQWLSWTNIPVPKVFDFNLDESNPVGVAYILMEKVPGHSVGNSLNIASSPEQRKKVLSQLADIYVELFAHPLDAMGSLDHPLSSHIGPFARESLTDFQAGAMKPMKPCSSIEEFYTASIQLTLELILRREIYTTRPVDAFLTHRFLLDAVSRVFSNHDLDDGKFYLRHADDKGDHIFVDDEFNITGIIDWEWASSAPKFAAFNSPIGLLPVKDFYEGINDIGEDEIMFAKILEQNDHVDLGRIVRNGRLGHLFQFCCGYDLSDWDGFLGLFGGLLKGLGDEEDFFNWETWKAKALVQYRNDDRLQELLRRPCSPR